MGGQRWCDVFEAQPIVTARLRDGWRRAVHVESEFLDRDGGSVLLSVTEILHRDASSWGGPRYLRDDIIGSRDGLAVERRRDRRALGGHEG